MPALFISFEGGEGSGKTTQINKLAEALTERGLKVVTTREPGGTPEGDKVRDLIVQRDGGDWSPLAETLLLFAARTMHVQKTILPALENGKVVITDRFTDSTVSYQGYGHGLNIDTIEQINSIVLDGLKPDLTFILDIDAKAGLQRSERRLASEQFGVDQTEDRFERLDISFHEKLRQGFLEIAKNDPARCHVIDATQDVEQIAQQIEGIVTDRLEVA
ncbi:MAG: dTMP kinase [Alphaproteobacteria bacterium]|nr:dTMP kinase [Alphaproteobacteria bacterium]